MLFQTLGRPRHRDAAATEHGGVNEEVGQERFAGRVRHGQQPSAWANNERGLGGRRQYMSRERSSPGVSGIASHSRVGAKSGQTAETLPGWICPECRRRFGRRNQSAGELLRDWEARRESRRQRDKTREGWTAVELLIHIPSVDNRVHEKRGRIRRRLAGQYGRGAVSSAANAVSRPRSGLGRRVRRETVTGAGAAAVNQPRRRRSGCSLARAG